MIYDQMYVYVDGALLAENTSVDLSWEGDNQDVLTTVQGWAGVSPSPKMINATLSNVLPVTGFEFDFITAIKETWEVSLTFQFGGSGEIIESKGYFKPPLSIAAGVGQTTTLSISFTGKV